MDSTASAAGLLLLFAGLQLLLSGWRDLGPVTVICGGIVALLLPGPVTQAALAVAALLAAISWARAARLGVGQPAHVGLALTLALAGWALAPWLEGQLPQPELVVASAEGGLGALVAVLALRRPTSSRLRVRWKGDIAVRAPSPPAETGGGPSRSPGPGAG
jgi:hypothetical protein